MKLFKTLIILLLLMLSQSHKMIGDEEVNDLGMSDDLNGLNFSFDSDYMSPKKKEEVNIDNYKYLIINPAKTKVTKVYYNHKKGLGEHASVFITLENLPGSIRYERLFEGNNVNYDKNRKVNADDNTTEYNPIPELNLETANELFKQIKGDYEMPVHDVDSKKIEVRNCYSFADILIEKLTDIKEDYTKIYLKKEGFNVDNNEIVKSKRKIRKIRKLRTHK